MLCISVRQGLHYRLQVNIAVFLLAVCTSGPGESVGTLVLLSLTNLAP